MSGCRCPECRAANSAYEGMRARARRNGDWNGVVSADKARAHIRALGRQGVGYKMVAEATNLASSIVFEIRSKRRLQIRARTERKILAVTVQSAGDAALVPAAPTWKLIGELLEEGYTRSRIAAELGRKGRGLQINPKVVQVRTAARVRAVYTRLTA